MSTYMFILRLIFKSFLISTLTFFAFYASAAFAAAPDAGTMLMNFARTVPQFMRLVTALGYVMGMAFIFKSLMQLKEYGEQRTMMSSQHSLKGPLLYMFAGTMLLYLPSSVNVGLNTFWTEPNPYGWVDDAGVDPWSLLYQNIFLIVQLIGTIAFIRGLIILTQLGQGGGQPGTMGRGFTHIIAGVMCINLYDFINMVDNTLGISGPLT